MPTTLNPPDTVHALRCLEVWGGNRAIETGFTVPGIDAWISSRPCEGDTRGGDVHYISMCGAGRISRFVVADIAGHGAAVGELAGSLRKLMRKHIRTPDQTRFARALNDEFLRLAQHHRFATALLTTYFAPTDNLIVCNAGHPRPMWHHAASGTWTLLDLVRQLPADPPAEQGRSILSAVTQFRGGHPSEDDETIVVLHHNASNPPKQSLGEKMRVMARMLGLGPGGT
jgi:hypothetical protein